MCPPVSSSSTSDHSLWSDVDEDEDAKDTKLISKSIDVLSHIVAEAHSVFDEHCKVYVSNMDGNDDARRGEPTDREPDVRVGFRRMAVVETDCEDSDDDMEPEPDRGQLEGRRPGVSGSGLSGSPLLLGPHPRPPG